MDELQAYRREQAVRALVPLFFVSGATALVYQNIWARQLQLVFGTSQFAIATVLSAFMAGLAMGGFVMARYADRLTRPLRTYGLIEIGIGAYALIFPTLLDAATPLYLSFHRAFDPGPVSFGLFQFVLLGVLLLLPTTGMGATLPLLGRFVTTRVGAAGGRIGLLYGVNTFGAVLGIWLAGFFLLPGLGLWKTTLLAALGNLLLGVGALTLSRQAEEGDQAPEVERDIAAPPGGGMQPVLIVAALTGFAALIYEVAWFRLMGLVLGASTYAFSVMLLAFLTGIAGGGWAGGPLADRVLRRFGPGGPLAGLAWLQVGIATLTYAMMHLYEQLPYWFVAVYSVVEGAEGLLWPAKVGLAALVMTPPALLMGASFPFLVRAAVRGDDDALGRPVGRVYGANTLGSIFGAFAGGFLLLPVLNVVGTVRVAGGANLAAALVAYTGAMVAAGGVKRGRQALAVAGAVGAVLLSAAFPPPWNPLLMTAGMYKYVSSVGDRSREGIYRFAVEEYMLLFYDEGLSTVVTVAQSRESGNIWLANNGKVDASTTVDMPTQVLVTHLPFLFVEDPEDTLVVGLASGITLGALTLHPEPDRIDVVELEPSIVQASHFFDDHNHRPLSDPRVTLYANDGRNHLVLTEPETYDLVVSEPSNPWLTGVSNLFTHEFFQMGKSRLKPGGVWSQWVQLYGMNPDDLRSLLRTFADVYPHVALFATIEDADLVLIGSDAPLTFTPEAAERLLTTVPAVRDELAQIDVTEPYDLLTYYQFGRDEILELVEDIDLNTDDNMRVEFSAPRNLHRETSSDNFLLLLPKSRAVELEGVDENIALARAYARREEWVRALICLKRVTDMQPQHVEARMLTLEYGRALKAKLEEDED
ncbi:MAG: fused MFS/spermidine synthase [Alphaproteobacteria bacterium]|nr:fused MFS/spermidine synthase [Alphaproteobacteria bacterium]